MRPSGRSVLPTGGRRSGCTRIPARPTRPPRPSSRALSDAYHVLRDPSRRAAYDRQRGASPVARPDSPGRAGTADRTGWTGRQASRATWPGHAPLWAGPVRIEPPAGTPPGDTGLAEAAGLAALIEMLRGYLGGEWGWPR